MFNKLIKFYQNPIKSDRFAFILDKKDIDSFALYAFPKSKHVSAVITFTGKHNMAVRYEGSTLDEIMDKIESDTLKE